MSVGKPRILHVANWYPNPWDNVEGNFIWDQIRIFREAIPGEAIVVQVRSSGKPKLGLSRCRLSGDARGYFLHAPIRPGKIYEVLSTMFLIAVLIRERAWRFDVFHFHIAYPLLLYSRLWRWIFRRPIVISEHWSAYHFNFYLPENSRPLRTLREPFQQHYPVLAVSKSLLNDLHAFAKSDSLQGFIVPNYVPLHGYTDPANQTPILFAVNRWRAIKNPMPMLVGLEAAAQVGAEFQLVIGGFGEMDEMKAFVQGSGLRDRAIFPGKMTKSEIAEQLSRSDCYLFSSNYETFSVACAEALGAGVPLMGPSISAIAEYAGPDDWVKVQSRDPSGWQEALETFLRRRADGEWDGPAIAKRAEQRFSEDAIRASYRSAMREIGLLQPT